MPINEEEKLGIAELLTVGEDNRQILIQVARSASKNLYDIANTQDALDILFTHVGDTGTLLNKRNITKDVLFKYLHSKQVPITTDFTKAALIKKVINFWNSSMHTTQISSQEQNNYVLIDDAVTGDAVMEIASGESSCAPNSNFMEQTLYPIHLLARKFAEWFFSNYNENKLTVADLWPDTSLQLRMAANDRIDEVECHCAEAVLTTLMTYKMQFGFLYNPNLSHNGVQGRMDTYGLVVVLACGTLHTQENCVGVFECRFGLLRDPYSDNNWKIKTIQCMLRSQNTQQLHSLDTSETLRDALALPVPTGELG